MNVRHARGRFDLVLRDDAAVVSVCDILANGEIEQDGFLLDEAHQRAKPAKVENSNVVPVEKHLSSERVVEALQQRHRCGLATARRTNERGRVLTETFQ